MPLRGMASATATPQRHLDHENGAGEDHLPQQGVVETVGIEHLLVPFHALPEEDVIAERLLHGVVDDGHERDQRVEGDKGHHRKDEQPSLLI